MLELEQEISDPSGISTVDPPKRVLNGVLVSQPCGVLYHIDQATGIRYATPLRLGIDSSDETTVRGATIVTSLSVRHCPS